MTAGRFATSCLVWQEASNGKGPDERGRKEVRERRTYEMQFADREKATRSQILMLHGYVPFLFSSFTP